MFISDILTSGAIPSLELTLRFAGERQKVINHNIANLDTPNFRPVDVSTAGFQRSLAEAIRQRRERAGGMHGQLALEDTREVRGLPDGSLGLTPRTPSGHILFHDRNNCDEIRLMQDNAENATVYRIASEALRGRYQQLRDAIAERV
jgi:flagellar basal-body rod protein FlgB